MQYNIFIELLTNFTFWIAIFACLLAQALKVLVEYWRTKTVNTAMFFSTGGMPSSHSSFVTAMSVCVGYFEGFDSSMFAISAILSLVVMYDAAGVRRAAGKQAEVINMMVSALENQGVTIDEKLKELLGHSPIEVAVGAILGIFVATCACGFFGSLMLI